MTKRQKIKIWLWLLFQTMRGAEYFTECREFAKGRFSCVGNMGSMKLSFKYIKGMMASTTRLLMEWGWKEGDNKRLSVKAMRQSGSSDFVFHPIAELKLFVKVRH